MAYFWAGFGIWACSLLTMLVVFGYKRAGLFNTSWNNQKPLLRVAKIFATLVSTLWVIWSILAGIWMIRQSPSEDSKYQSTTRGIGITAIVAGIILGAATSRLYIQTHKKLPIDAAASGILGANTIITTVCTLIYMLYHGILEDKRDS